MMIPKIDGKYLIRVIDYHRELLPKPQQKKDKNKSETLKELGIITVDTGLWSSSI